MRAFVKKHFLFLAVFLAALVVRLIFVWQWQGLEYAQAFLLDAKSYDEWALQISDGQWLRDRAFYQSPLYPYFVGVIYSMFGRLPLLISVLQCLALAWFCGAFAVLTERCFGRTAAVTAGVLMIFYRPLIFFSAPLMKEAFGIVVLGFCVLLVHRALRTKKLWQFLVAGLVFGVSLLLRGNVLLVLPLLFFLFYQGRGRSGLKAPLLFVLGAGLGVMPATLHNMIVSHDFLLVNYTGGFNLYIGNSPTGTGANSYPPEVSSEPREEEFDVVRIAETEAGRALKPSEVAKHWSAKAIGFAVHNPAAAGQLLLSKSILFFSDYEAPDNYDLGFITRNLSTMIGFPLVGFGILLSLAFISILRFRDVQIRQDLRFFWIGAGLYFVSVLPFYVTDRYRLPVVIFLFPLAGLGVASIFQYFRTQKIKNAVAAVISFVFMITLTNWKTPESFELSDAQGWGVIGGLRYELGRYDEAIRAVALGLSIAPEFIQSDSLVKASYAAEELKRVSEGRMFIDQAMKNSPQSALVYYAFGRHLMQTEDIGGAEAQFLTAVNMAPWDYRNHLGVALSRLKLGRRQDARPSFLKALELKPADPQLLQLKDLFR